MNPWRVLVVDDDPAIREAYRHILQPPPTRMADLEAMLGGAGNAQPAALFEVTLAAQGEEAEALQQAAVQAGRPFQTAFIDMRMPPGQDGLRTALALRRLDPGLFVVIATAFSDYGIDALQQALSHDVLLLRKPFQADEVFQLARTLCQSWETRRRLEQVTAEMERHVQTRAQELERRNVMQSVLIDVANRFIEAGLEADGEDAVNWSLARLGRAIDVDVCALYRLDAERDVYRLSHEWHGLGMQPIAAELREIPRRQMGAAHARFLRGESFAYASLGSLPEEMTTWRSGMARRMEQCLAAPLESSGRLLGFLGVGIAGYRSVWETDLEPLLRALGHTLVSALENHEAGYRLRESQEMLRATQHAAHMGNWTLDADGRHGWWDEEVRRILGVGADLEATPASLANLVRPEDWPALWAALQTSLRTGAAHRMEYRIRRPDGQERWLNCWAEAQYGEAGQVRRLVGMVQDISERRSQEDRLRLLSEAVEQSPASVVITDTCGSIQYVNRRFSEVTGYPFVEVIGQNPRILKSGQMPEALYADLWRTILAGGVWRGRLYNRRRDGEMYWEQAVIRGMTDAGGRTTHLLAVKQDISEQIEADRALQEAEGRYATLVQNIPGVVYRCALDEHWTIHFMSDFIETLSGYPIADFIDNRVRSYASLIHPEDVDLVDAGVRAAVAAHQTFVLEYRILHADGGIRWVHERGRASYDASDCVAWLDGVITDITQQRQAEADLHTTLIKYQVLFDTFPLGITITDPAGHILETNVVAEHLLGVPREQHVQRGIDSPEWRIVRPDGSSMPAEEFASVRALKERRRVENVEMGIVQEGRPTTWISVTADLLPLEGYGVVVTYGDITARREAEEQIHWMAYHDALTGLPNRRLLLDRLRLNQAASQRDSHFGALLLLDLDHFKPLNDRFGHDVGDQLLIEVARRLSAQVREADTVARLGGDEFVVMLSQLGREADAAARHTTAIGEKIRESLAAPYVLEGVAEPYASSASIGVRLFQGSSQSPEAILKDADLALYRAKEQGRNQVRE